MGRPDNEAELRMSVDRLAPRPAWLGGLLLGAPKAFLASVGIVALFWAFFNDRLAVTPGLEWLPRIRLRMEFNSFPFMLLFVPCTFALYAAGARHAGRQLGVGLREPRHLRHGRRDLSDPAAVHMLVRLRQGAFLARSPDSRLRTAAFVVSVAVQLALLCTFKYAGWLTGEFNDRSCSARPGSRRHSITLPLPPGISFYTFHTISYTADIYQRKFKPTGHLRRLCDLRRLLSPTDRRSDRPRLRATAASRAA